MNKDSGPPALFSIGLNVGGLNPANRDVYEALAAFQRRVVRERETFVNEGLRVNLVFDIPGQFFRPDFEGVVATRFERKRAHLLVLAAVPDKPRPADTGAYISGVLDTVRREAHAYAARRRLRVDLTNLDALLTRLQLPAAGPPFQAGEHVVFFPAVFADVSDPIWASWEEAVIDDINEAAETFGFHFVSDPGTRHAQGLENVVRPTPNYRAWRAAWDFAFARTGDDRLADAETRSLWLRVLAEHPIHGLDPARFR